MFNIPNVYDPNAPTICPWCKKPRTLYNLADSQAYYITTTCTILPISAENFCPGHVSEECPVCRWMVVLEYHTPEDCERLRDGSR